MKREDTPEIKKFKRAFGAVRDARLTNAIMNQPQPILVPLITRQEVQSWMKKSGLDLRDVDRKAQRQTAAVLGAAERNRTQAIKYSRKVKSILDGAAEAWRNGAQISLQGAVQRYFLDTPFLIWPNPESMPVLDASMIQPANSSVKLQCHLEYKDQYVNRMGEVTIFFRWTNPSDYPTMISVDSYAIFSGWAQAVALGSWSESTVWLTVGGGIEVYLVGDQYVKVPPDAGVLPVNFNVQNQDGPFYHHTFGVSKNVFRGYDMQIHQVLVPANSDIILNLTFEITVTMFGPSTVDVDFSSDSTFGVTAPGILITKWN